MKSTECLSPISITGAGVISCAGQSLASFWQSALDGNIGLNASGLGEIPGFDDSEQLCKPALIARHAIDAAMLEAGWPRLGKDDGLIIATTVGQIPLWEKDLTQYISRHIDEREFGRRIIHQSLGSIVEAVARSLNFDGKSLLVTSACSASTQAIGLAAHWIRQGRVKRCLVGGTEVLSRLTIEGFRSLQLLSPQTCRPFDQNRQGINLSEGAAFFCLEPGSQDLGDRAIADVTGVGFSTDAYHMAAPHPEGRGSYEAMRLAIDSAGLRPSDIDWVHAHGTGSKANDQSEGAAIHQLFGTDDREGPWVSSTKALHGHALGASGAIEVALCLQAMRKKTVLRTIGLTTPDPMIQVRHPHGNLACEIRHIVKNTLGFGGNNAALVLSLHESHRSQESRKGAR